MGTPDHLKALLEQTDICFGEGLYVYLENTHKLSVRSENSYLAHMTFDRIYRIFGRLDVIVCVRTVRTYVNISVRYLRIKSGIGAFFNADRRFFVARI